MSTYREAITLVLLFALAVVFSTTSLADSSIAFRGKAQNMKFVGTYYDVTGRTVIIHSDGTTTTTRGDMFNHPEGRRQTPGLGVWRKVGKNEIKTTTIFFWSEEFGDTWSTNGLTAKITYTLILDDAVNGVSPGWTAIDGMAEIFLPDQNPILDDPIAVAPAADKRAYRLEVAE